MSAADERDQGNTGPPVIDIAGVVMYVGPVDYDTYSPLCMREVALIDAAMRIIFLHIFEELVERHWNELLPAEANVGLIMATSMKVHQLSKTLSTGQQLYAYITPQLATNFTFLKVCMIKFVMTCLSVMLSRMKFFLGRMPANKTMWITHLSPR
ncbi:uncharacterized protein [Aegilops tauschii subsp. strangulata]|uniref:uncharacterized protein isoform X2 n=1 Tax=Aegilops tauschii subsp. strangulata TaxID=200361 RepID=UPI00098BC446|nr:uncharacterized protein LOC109740301 isoform X2 [Aegilops tauschii subsp. strangulata]